MGLEVHGVLAALRGRQTLPGVGTLPGTSFLDAVGSGQLPNVSYVDPAFEDEGTGTSGDYHPLCDIRLGERFVADVYHALHDRDTSTRRSS